MTETSAPAEALEATEHLSPDRAKSSLAASPGASRAPKPYARKVLEPPELARATLLVANLYSFSFQTCFCFKVKTWISGERGGGTHVPFKRIDPYVTKFAKAILALQTQDIFLWVKRYFIISHSIILLLFFINLYQRFFFEGL